jgi:hypothetical protein
VHGRALPTLKLPLSAIGLHLVTGKGDIAAQVATIADPADVAQLRMIIGGPR